MNPLIFFKSVTYLNIFFTTTGLSINSKFSHFKFKCINLYIKNIYIFCLFTFTICFVQLFALLKRECIFILFKSFTRFSTIFLCQIIRQLLAQTMLELNWSGNEFSNCFYNENSLRVSFVVQGAPGFCCLKKVLYSSLLCVIIS